DGLIGSNEGRNRHQKGQNGTEETHRVISSSYSNYNSVACQNFWNAPGQLRSITRCRASRLICARNLESRVRRLMACAKSSGSCAFVTNPVAPSSTSSFGPPRSETITG